MGKIITLSGASGVGKTSVAWSLLSLSLGLRMVESHTTRKPRVSDLKGEYHHVDGRAFDILSRSRVFAWTAESGHTRYATSRKALREAVECNYPRLMILVPERARTLPKITEEWGTPEVISLFLYAKENTIRNRLEERDGKSPETERRLEEGFRWQEAAFNDPFWHLICNEGRAARQTAEFIAREFRL